MRDWEKADIKANREAMGIDDTGGNWLLLKAANDELVGLKVEVERLRGLVGDGIGLLGTTSCNTCWCRYWPEQYKPCGFCKWMVEAQKAVGQDEVSTDRSDPQDAGGDTHGA